MALSTVVLAVLCSFDVAAREQDAAAPAAPVATSRVALTFEALELTAKDLPADVTLGSEPACVSIQAATFFESMAGAPLLPEPKQKRCQTLIGKQTRGSLLRIEYPQPLDDEQLGFIRGVLWGDGDKPSREHPEELIARGNLVLILSFPPNSAERTIAVGFLRQKVGLRLNHDFGALRAVLMQVNGAYQRKDAKAGLKLLADAGDKAERASYCAFYEAELCALAQDWVPAEAAYRRCLELDGTTDPLPNDATAWAATNGRATALYYLKKYDEALGVYKRAVEMVAEFKLTKEQAAVCLYNGACSAALAGKPDAIGLLQRSIELDPTFKEKARADADFDGIRQSPEFKQLVQ